MTNAAAEFDSYLKSEYAHIAEAHFRTIDTITAFFRYYLLIMSIPIGLIVAFITIGEPFTDSFEVLRNYTPVLATICLVISLAGFGVLLHLVSLRMDAILYARTVNAIRKHFYDNVPEYVVDLDTKLRMRVLPQTSSQPSYLEWRYFGPVVSVLAILDTFYLFGATSFFTMSFIPEKLSWQLLLEIALPISLVFLGLHFIAYWRYASYREHTYLKSYVLGVDICGVLNEHRPRFCEVLRKTVGKIIDPEDITVVPVHEHPTLNITREDEKRVFNEPEYWMEMSPTESSVDRLKSLRKAFKLKVILFTHRPWPNTVDMAPDEEKQVRDKWKKAAEHFYKMRLERGKLSRVRLFKNPLRWIRMEMGVAPIEPIEQITRKWLEYHEYEYDELIIEKGSDDIADPQVHFRNRFYISRQKKIKFFVEDILEKAEKLAHICDVVFLFDHPYNRNPERRKLPSNIIIVNSWEDIYKEIRKLS